MKKVKIIHINQQHKLPFGIKPVPETVKATVQSQFMIAQELKKHLKCPILLEGLYEDGFNGTSLPFAHVAKMLFPKGFPKNFAELTQLQQDFLYDQGAVFTLFYLGEIPSMCKSIHKEASRIINKQISEGAYEKIHSPREIEAIECAKEAAIRQFGTLDNATVIIVFGGAHNFKPYCEKEGFEHEVINTQVTPSSQQNPSYIAKESFSAEKAKQNMNEDPLGALNRRLEEYPGDITSRLKRAELHITQSNHEKALEDYNYVHSKYPANSDALKGIETCNQRLASIIPPDSSISKTQSTFFVANSPSSSIAAPVELQKALSDSRMLKGCLAKGHVTLDSLIDLQQDKPWVVDALRCSNIYKGICNHFININQLSKLTEEQVASVIHKFNGAELQLKVESLVKLNQQRNPAIPHSNKCTR